MNKARVAVLGGYNTHGKRADSIPMTARDLAYTVKVGVGSPPTTYNLVVSLGSSITWVGGSTTYVKTDTSVFTGFPVKESYGPEGEVFFEAIIYRDTVTLGGGLTVTNFQLGVASTAEGFVRSEDGVLGLGPEDLSRNTMPLAMHDTIPTITDRLFEQGKINRRVVGIFLRPTFDLDDRFGELTFGEPDNSKYMGTMVYTPITDIAPSSRAWGIKQRITYGQEEILGTTDGVIDISNNLIFIATGVYPGYEAATGGILDPRTGLLRITRAQYTALQPLEFHIEGRIFSLTRNAQIWPRSLNPTFFPDVEFENIYLVVADIGRPSGSGLDFRIGYPFMQRFYTVFDSSEETRRVGFAPTQFTDAMHY
ncbi:family A1 protease [Suillus spraguei]|nr:family A1 protease [Suillus spraguei]